MGGKRKCALTRSQCCKKFCGNPSPLNKTEPQTFRQVIQYSYFLTNSHPNMTYYTIAKIIAKEIIEIWQAVNLRLPLHSEYYMLKLIDKVCFKKVKAVNRKSLSIKQSKNLEEKLDKLFDISTCTCSLPVRSCDDNAVKCNAENCQKQHIIYLCPPGRKVPAEEREYLNDQRIKIGPRGTFQLGSVDKAAAQRDQRATVRADRLRNQKQLEIESSTSASTSVMNPYLECSTEESSKTGSDDEEFKLQKQPSGFYSTLKVPRKFHDGTYQGRHFLKSWC